MFLPYHWRNLSCIYRRYIGISWALFLRKPIGSSIILLALGRLSFFLSLTVDIIHFTMLSPVSYVLFLLSMIRCCVTSSDLGTQDGELFSSFDAEEPNNPFHASESLDRTDNREFPEIGLIQSIDQCQYNSNEKFRKMRSKREACPSLHQPFRDNGRSGAEAPSPLPQIVPAAGEYPATVNSVQSPNPDDSLCPPTARYPVCADPVAFPIAPDTLFIHDLSRMQLKYCRACTYIINPSLLLYTGRREILVRC